MATAVTSKGQVTIPKPIRDRLGIEPGNLVGSISISFWARPPSSTTRCLVKVDGARRVSRFEALRGRAGAGLSTDEIMALTRGDE